MNLGTVPPRAASVDYVLKPVVEDRQHAAVRRAVSRLREQRRGDLAGVMAKLLERVDGARGDRRVAIKTERGVALIPAADIQWVEADGRTRVSSFIDMSSPPLRKTSCIATAGTAKAQPIRWPCRTSLRAAPNAASRPPAPRVAGPCVPASPHARAGHRRRNAHARHRSSPPVC